MMREDSEMMNVADALQHPKLAHSQALVDLISISARLLFADGQSTERMVAAVGQLTDRIGMRASIFPRWGELIIRIEDDSGSRCEIVAASPVGVDMNKVVATMGVIDQVCDGRKDAVAARSALEAISHFPPVSTVRFALMAAAGAAALAVIFGAAHLLSLLVIAFSAGAGACLRRWLAGKSRNLFVQPFCAALLAGVIGAIFARMQLSSVLRLVAVCPCMVLVPGPHFLNGGIDFARGHIALGAARITYACLITSMICAGLLMGLALGGVTLPASGPSHSVPIEYDVVAAAVAVAAYGTFFAMPWRMLPVPIVIGMLAHASRWVAISLAGTSAVTGAFVACLVVGVLMTPIADYLRLPFAGLAFASVVSLIPGVFLFRMAGGMVDLVTLGTKNHQDLVVQIFADGTTALLIIFAMGFGLIVPKMCIEHFLRPLAFCK
jgi:uncharacterized membrane protein YjjP (DUF1212 family)